MSSQAIAVAPNSPTSMGCKTATPLCEARTPVATGKMEPPICAKTKTKARAVDRISGGKSFEPTETPLNESAAALVKDLKRSRKPPKLA